jgi:hypothetical protein
LTRGRLMGDPDLDPDLVRGKDVFT